MANNAAHTRSDGGRNTSAADAYEQARQNNRVGNNERNDPLPQWTVRETLVHSR
jgi:hypothetical protein